MSPKRADPVSDALRGGPLTATGVLTSLWSQLQSPGPTVGRLFWTLDRLVEAGAIREEVDWCGERRYRLVGCTLPVDGLGRAVAPMGGEPQVGGREKSAFQVMTPAQPPPFDEREDGLGVRFCGSLSIATRQMSLRTRMEFVATSRPHSRHPS
jgi:hypothetical protein